MSECEVRTCDDCPFMWSHEDSDGERWYFACTLGERFMHVDIDAPPPSWCPLRLGPVTLRLVPR